MSRISVVGMGYVGLPLGTAFDAAGYEVVGYDTDRRTVERLGAGEDPTDEVGAETVRRSEVTFTADAGALAGSDYYLITVPTPVDDEGRPDLAFVESAGETVGEVLGTDATVALESTVYPGATRERLVPALERASGLTAGEEFFVGYSPERTVPGNAARGLADIVKLVSGHDETARERLRALYEDVVDAGVHVTPTMETAEAAKCLENTQRDVNIALMNEFAYGCHHLDLPVEARDVVEAASTKWNFHGYHPGSVGGHCIPVDPKYLIWQFDRHGFDPRLMRAARATNDDFAAYVSRLTADAFAERLSALSTEVAGVDEETGTTDGGWTAEGAGEGGSRAGRTNGGRVPPALTGAEPRLLVLGFAYKPDTNDVRSPVLEDAVDRLRDVVELVGVDPHAPDDRIRSTFDLPVQSEFSVAGFDGLLLATAHERFASMDLAAVSDEMNELPVLVDVTGTYDRETVRDHGFVYRGL